MAESATDAVVVHGWRFSSHKSGISSSAKLDEIAEYTGLAILPEMVYGDNFLRLQTDQHHLKLGFSFSAVPALKRCLHSTMQRVQVAVAHKWQLSSEHVQAQDYDWTYCSDYRGDVAADSTVEPLRDDSWYIDVEVLKRPEKFLHYDDVILYEDELHDHGVSVLSVKVRVMPSCFLVLLRHWLRVDGVLLRVTDTRIFHEFASDKVLREFKMSEVLFEELVAKGLPHHSARFKDANDALPYLTQKQRVMEVFKIK